MYNPVTEDVYFTPYNILGNLTQSTWQIQPGQGAVGTVINIPSNLPKINASERHTKTLVVENGNVTSRGLVVLPTSIVKPEPKKRGRKPGTKIKSRKKGRIKLSPKIISNEYGIQKVEFKRLHDNQSLKQLSEPTKPY